jgi:cytochrome c-type biogenesis protein
MLSLSVPLVFVAGLLTFLAPCTLPLVPIYLGYLSGSSLSGDAPPQRWKVFSHALAFVAGFTLVFVILFGLPTTLLSGVLLRYKDWITLIGGALLILFGLHTMRVINIPALNMTRRMEVDRGMEPGYGRSVLVGVTFAAGWTPCVGPLLGTVMTLAFTEPSRGLALTLVYAAGLATPFLLTAALLTQAVGWLRRLNRYARVLEIASGVLIVAIGVLLISGLLPELSRLFLDLTPEWLLRYL